MFTFGARLLLGMGLPQLAQAGHATRAAAGTLWCRIYTAMSYLPTYLEGPGAQSSSIGLGLCSPRDMGGDEKENEHE
jgi:hypothetical protein